jgi:hypothetical protein
MPKRGRGGKRPRTSGEGGGGESSKRQKTVDINVTMPDDPDAEKWMDFSYVSCFRLPTEFSKPLPAWYNIMGGIFEKKAPSPTINTKELTGYRAVKKEHTANKMPSSVRCSQSWGTEIRARGAVQQLLQYDTPVAMEIWTDHHGE